jgi:cyclophilin family peptidyl-prolyl cis-trans isomerase
MNKTTISLWTAVYLLGTFYLAACSDRSKPEAENLSQTASETSTNNSKDLFAVVETDKGDFKMKLRPDIAPMSTANFINLVQRGFYHGKEVVASNRISASYGLGEPVPIYKVQNEYSPKLIFDRPGVVAWTFLDTQSGNKNQISHPTRFFIAKEPNEKWTYSYCPFAEVVEGQEMVNGAQAGDWIKSVRIIGNFDSLMARHEDSVAKWNNALRLAGHYSPDELQNSDPEIPPPFINSN